MLGRRFVGLGVSSSVVAVPVSVRSFTTAKSVNVLATGSLSSPAKVQAAPLGLASAGMLQQQYRFGWMRPRNSISEGVNKAMNQELATEAHAKDFNVLAKAAHQAQNYEDAHTLYEKVLGWRRSVDGPTSEPVANTLHNMARVCIDHKKYPRAENYLTEACAIMENIHGKHHVKYADSLALLALCYRELQYWPQAEAAFKEALVTFKELLYNHNDHTWLPEKREVLEDPSQSPLATVAHILADCSVLFIHTHQEDNALAFLEDALAIRRYLYSKNSKFKPIIAQTLCKIAELRRTFKSDAVGALAMLDEAIAICLATLGREHAATAAAISSKGNSLVFMKRHLEALKCYEEAATTYALQYGKESHLVGMELLHVGQTLQALGGRHFASAEAKFIKAGEIIRKSLGHDHVQVADANAYFADWLLKKGDTEGRKRAVTCLREAIRIRGGIKNDAQMPHLLQKLGDALGMELDPECEARLLEACELHRTFIKASPKQEEVRELLISDALDSLGNYYLLAKMFDKAEETLVESLELRQKWLPINHPTIGYSYGSLGQLHMHKEEYSKAVGYTMQQVEIYEEAVSTFNEKTAGHNLNLALADAHVAYGQAQQAVKEFDRAKKCFEKALNIRQLAGENYIPNQVDCYLNLAWCAAQRGDSDDDTGESLLAITEGKRLCSRIPDHEAVKTLRQRLEDLERDLHARSNEPEKVKAWERREAEMKRDAMAGKLKKPE